MTQINVDVDIQDVALDDIHPVDYNPREISDPALAGLRKSLTKFGLLDLLIVNKRNMCIVGGNQRYKLLREAGVERVKVIMVDLDELNEKALNLTLNNSEIMGVWSKMFVEVVEQLRQELPEEDYLDLRICELRESLEYLEEDKEGESEPDDIPDKPKQTITRPGDLWILGDHRLLCGDSGSKKAIGYLMDGKKAKMIATDPPYCIDYTGADRPGGGKDWSDVYKETEIKDAVMFWRSFLLVAFDYAVIDAPIYFWYASSKFEEVVKTFKSLDILLHQQIIWVKPCANLTFSVYPWRHEPCVFGWRRTNKPFFRPSRKKMGTVWKTDFMRSGDPADPEHYTDLWEIDYEGRKRPQGGMHPTVKPVEVFAIPMRVHTKPGDICLEPFNGSGSQMIAAEMTNRRCYACEIEPVFCDVTVKRWETFTGNKAELIRN